MIWTDDMSITLKTMWRGGSTAAEIGSALGLTRDAVLGRVKRMGLTRSGSTLVPAAFSVRTVAREPREIRPLPAESRVWTLADDKRKRMFARRAAKGAKQALEACGL